MMRRGGVAANPRAQVESPRVFTGDMPVVATERRSAVRQLFDRDAIARATRRG